MFLRDEEKQLKTGKMLKGFYLGPILGVILIFRGSLRQVSISYSA